MQRMVTVISALFLLQTSACSRAPSTASLKDQVNPVGSDAALEVRVQAPGQRALPTDPNVQTNIYAWCLTGGACPQPNALFWVPTSNAVPDADLVKRMPLALSSTYGVSLIYDNAANQYLGRIELGGGTINAALIHVDVALGRVDVNHMVVTRPDGTTYAAKGTAIISRIGAAQSEAPVVTISTGYGVDVPSGARYKVVVNALAEDGPKTSTAFLDL